MMLSPYVQTDKLQSPDTRGKTRVTIRHCCFNQFVPSSWQFGCWRRWI